LHTPGTGLATVPASPCGVGHPGHRRENPEDEGGIMDRMTDLNDLFVHELKDLYSAETQILDALPKMAEAAEHQELRQAFQEHERTTREQVKRLDMIADDLGVKIQGHTCKGMKGILDEG
jgi:ferritin-like metal-binding protein YciE